MKTPFTNSINLNLRVFQYLWGSMRRKWVASRVWFFSLMAELSPTYRSFLYWRMKLQAEAAKR